MSWVPLVGATIATCCQNLGISSVVYIVLRYVDRLQMANEHMDLRRTIHIQIH